jgi:uncharacterized membrane protein YfcA
MTPPVETALIMLIVFAAALLRCTFGFGDALIAMPLLVFLMPVTDATPMVALTSVTISVVITLQDWEHVHLASAKRLLAAAAVGIPLGLLWLLGSGDRAVKGLLALMILGFSTYSLCWPGRTVLRTERTALAFGFLSGLLGAAYNTYGPPLVVYGTLRGWNPRQFRATLSGFFLSVGLLILPVHAAAGLWSTPVFRNYLWCLPAVAIALPLGTFINRRLSSERFLPMVHVGLLLIAASLIVHLIIDSGTSAP